MCSTFDSLLGRSLLKEHFGLTSLPDDLGEDENRRPDDLVLSITQKGTACLLSWGFKVGWSKQLLINARCETVLEKPSFAATHNNRCLVPARSWYEWRTDDIGKHKNKISVKGISAFALAAIEDEERERLCLLTCPAHNQIAPIHARMPLLIAPPFYEQWLDSSVKTQDIKFLLQTQRNIAFHWQETAKKDPQLRLL